MSNIESTKDGLVEKSTGQKIVSLLDIQPPTPTVVNCYIKSRGEILFYMAEGAIIPNLDGYAIIPMEEYKRLSDNIEVHCE